jgi:hypothetical protein
MLSEDVHYNDLGDLYLDKLNNHQVTRTLVHRLERLGYTITLAPQQQQAAQGACETLDGRLTVTCRRAISPSVLSLVQGGISGSKDLRCRSIAGS